jgi:hypothetical protein
VEVVNDYLEAALGYAERGWRVLPLHSVAEIGKRSNGMCSCQRRDCTSIAKHPRTLHGVKDATVKPCQIRKWWDMWPSANVGIACGSISGIVVVDIDPRNGGVEHINELLKEHGKLPQTTISATGGGGWHYVYAHSGERKGILCEGVDLVSDGGYIVAPPSLHLNGSYAWLYEVEDLPSLPAWVRDTNNSRRAPGANITIEVGDPLPKGSRNVTFIRIAGAMRRWGLGLDAIYAALTLHNEEVCDPPMSDQEVKRICANAVGYEPEVYGGQTQSDERESLRVEDSPMAKEHNGT